MGLNLGNLTQGLYPGGRAIIKKHWFGTTDYDGKIKKAPYPTVMFAEIVPVGDGEGEAFTEIFSMGKGLIATKDGMGVDPEPGAKKGKEGIGKGTKTGMYLASVGKPLDEPDAGFSLGLIGDDISILDGIEVNLKRVDMPKWQGKATEVFAGQGQSDDEPKTVLVITEFYAKSDRMIEAEGGKPAKSKAAPTKAAPAKGKPAPEPAADDDLKAAVSEAAVAFLRTQPNRTATVNATSRAVFKAFKGKDIQDAAAAIFNDDAFLGDDDAPWNYDDSDSTLQALK